MEQAVPNPGAADGNDPSLPLPFHHIFQVYNYYLFPLEEAMPRDKEARLARLIELMESKVRRVSTCG